MTHCDSVLRQINCRFEELFPWQFPEFVVRHLQASNGARDPYGAYSVIRIIRNVALIIEVHSLMRSERGFFPKIDAGDTPIVLGEQKKSTPSNVSCSGVRHCQSERHCDCRINRITSFLQSSNSNF